jgi:hypothetical protein
MTDDPGSIRTTAALCWHCDRLLTGVSTIKDEVTPEPEPGSLSFCLYCGSLCVFDENLTLRAPTVELLDELCQDEDFRREFVSFQWARQRALLEMKLLGVEEERTGRGTYEMWAWLVDDVEGDGVVAAVIPWRKELGPMTLQSRRREMAQALEVVALEHQKRTGRPVRLAHLVEVD